MTTTDIFREDNTEGYTTAQLAEANRRWRERHSSVDPDSTEGKHIAEKLLEEIDADDDMTTTTDTYYAICDANGPISVELDGSTVEEARASFGALDGRAAIDAARTDAEDALDICGEGMGDHEFAEALESAGAEAVGPLGEVDQHGRAIAGDWCLWRVRAEEGGAL